jgi:hypothetical protein
MPDGWGWSRPYWRLPLTARSELRPSRCGHPFSLWIGALYSWRHGEVAVAARRAGAFSAADTIEDRVANSLAVTIGYIDFSRRTNTSLLRPASTHSERLGVHWLPPES